LLQKKAEIKALRKEERKSFNISHKIIEYGNSSYKIYFNKKKIISNKKVIYFNKKEIISNKKVIYFKKKNYFNICQSRSVFTAAQLQILICKLTSNNKNKKNNKYKKNNKNGPLFF
jgi:hypothetical protein